MEQELTPEIALQNLALIIAQYKGTFQEHQLLQESLKVLGKLIQPEETE